jgi:hypothetical protein
VSYVRAFNATPISANAHLGDLCSEEEKNFVFDLTLGANDVADGAAEVAALIEVKWTNIETGELRSASTELMVTVVTPEHYVEPARDEDVVAEVRTIRLQEQKELAIELMREGRAAEAQAMMAALGAEYEHMLESFAGLSSRSRVRMQNEMRESRSFSTLYGDEFIKRGAESLNRKRSDKPDPRTKGDK